MPHPIEVGIVLREQDLSAWSGRLNELAGRTVAAGADHLTVGDTSASPTATVLMG